MHMWGHYEVYEKLINNPQAESYKEYVMHVKVPGQVFELTISLKENCLIMKSEKRFVILNK